MPRDFAKNHATKPTGPQLSRIIWFIIGLACGGLLVYLWISMPVEITEQDKLAKPVPQPLVEEQPWDFDFYEIFSSTEVPIDADYNDKSVIRVEEGFTYILQAGSFTTPEDADEMRAELLLMGLDVFVREVEVNGSVRHRVIVGPFPDQAALNQVQDKLSRARISAIPFRVNQ